MQVGAFDMNSRSFSTNIAGQLAAITPLVRFHEQVDGERSRLPVCMYTWMAMAEQPSHSPALQTRQLRKVFGEKVQSTLVGRVSHSDLRRHHLDR